VTTWLHRIVVNACLDRIRRRAIRPATPVGFSTALDSIAPQAPDPIDAHGSMLDVHAALRTLDDDCRAVIAFHLDGFSTVETATALGIDNQRVRNLRKKARAQLRRAVSTPTRQP
jgi:RNA polymerase sigma-70 factor (ECF subfamily)